MSFLIHDVKTVAERYEQDEVNSMLKNGWRLLAAGFNYNDDIRQSEKVYILGKI
jgi:hypothetical protein